MGFVVAEKRHGTFSREGCNLVHKARVSLADALTGFQVDVPTLDNRILRVNVKDIVTPDYTKVVKGEGMPCTKKRAAAGEAKGDLIMTFDVQFPSSLDDCSKQKLREALPDKRGTPYSAS